jgi:hypothetical protein
MNQLQSKSVVVGVDGSQAAVNAAKWAVGEAISRQIPLRLVHVVGRSEPQSAATQPSDWELESGETALYQADVAVQDVGRPVEVERVLLSGDPEQVLITGRVGMHFKSCGEPWRNGYVGSFNSGIRDECLNISSFCCSDVRDQ